MNKRIVFISICFLASACHQQSGSANENNPIAASDTSQGNLVLKADTTEIDVLKASPDKYKLVLENEHVRVIEYSLKPGEKDNPHTHRAKTSYVIAGGTFRVYPEHAEPFDYIEVQGATEWSDKTTMHYVENIGQTTITILLTEIKAAR